MDDGPGQEWKDVLNTTCKFYGSFLQTTYKHFCMDLFCSFGFTHVLLHTRVFSKSEYAKFITNKWLVTTLFIRL